MSFIQFKDHLREALKDPKLKAEYDKLRPEFDLIEAVIAKRIEKNLTQKELARRLGTKQSAISRLESGNGNPSVGFLRKVADALGVGLHISFR